MADFNVRSDSVNVEQIMEQIRARIREKRGVDYTEQQIRELAAVKLEKFLDPRGVRSDLLERFRTTMPAYEPPVMPNYSFEEETIFESHRGVIRFFRKLFRPLLKLFFNPNPLIQALNIQARLNTMSAERDARNEASRRALDQLYYELIHNLVIELTRTGIEVKNLKMRVESLSSRLEFNERRARALESAVVYKPSEPEPAPRPQPAVARHPSQPSSSPPTPQESIAAAAAADAAAQAAQPSQAGQGGIPGEGPGQRSRRRRRRRGRRGGGSATAQFGQGQAGQVNSGSAPAQHSGDPAESPSAASDQPEATAEHARDASSTHEGGAEAFEEFEDDGGPSAPESGSEPGAQ